MNRIGFKPRTNALVWVLACMLLAVGCKKQESRVVTSQTIEVTAVKVEPRDVPITFEWLAQTESSRQVEIRARVAGILEKRVYKEGAVVQEGLVVIIGRDPRYHVCGAAHTFEEANKLVRQHRPDVLLIEPFLENRDAIRWIEDLATEFPSIRILIVSRQSERTYAERALRAGASGYWMKNSSVAELMRAIETGLRGEIYASKAMTSFAMHKFAGNRNLPPGLDVLSNREMAVFALI